MYYVGLRATRFVSLLILLLVLGLPVALGAPSIPSIPVNLPTQAAERGYHSVLYANEIVSANTSSDVLNLNQSSYEFSDGKAILTTGSQTKLTSASQPIVLSAPGPSNQINLDSSQVGVGTTSPSSALTVDGQIQTASSSQTLFLPGGTGIRQFVTSISGSGNDFSVPTTSAVGQEVKVTNNTITEVNESATQTIAEVLAEGNIAKDTQSLGVDEVRARDRDGLLIANAGSSPGVFVDDAGQTGIGTTSPVSALTVDGQIQTASNSQTLFLPGGTGITQFVTSISGSGNDFSVPTTSAVDSFVDGAYTGGDGTTIDGSNNIDITAPSCDSGSDVLRWDGSSWTCGTDRFDSNSDAVSRCSGQDTYLDGNGNCRDMTSNTGSWFQGDNIQDNTVDNSEIQVGTLAGTGLNANSGNLNVKWEDANNLDSDGDVTGTKCSGDKYLAGDGTCKDDTGGGGSDNYLPDDPAPSNVDMSNNNIVGLADPAESKQAVNRQFLVTFLEQMGSQGCGALTLPASQDDAQWDGIISAEYCGLSNIDVANGEVTYFLRAVSITHPDGTAYEVKRDSGNHDAVCQAFLGGAPDSNSQYTSGGGKAADVSYSAGVGVDYSNKENNVAYGDATQDLTCTYNIAI